MRLGIGIVTGLLEHPTSVATVGALFRRGTTKEINGPWWNKRATRYLSERLQPGSRVFEWGSGGSTVWLIRHGADVTSVEHNLHWATKVTERCPTANVIAIPGVISGEIKGESEFANSGGPFFDDYVAAIDQFEDGSMDFVIVDGMCRMECVRRGAPKVKPGGLLIVDDTDLSFLNPAKLLPGWRAVRQLGFKATLDLRETTFFRRPA